MSDYWTYHPTGEKIPNEKKLEFVNELINKYRKEIIELKNERDYYKDLVLNTGLLKQKPIEYEIVLKAIELREKGLSFKCIGDELNISKTSAWNIINRNKNKSKSQENTGDTLAR